MLGIVSREIDELENIEWVNYPLDGTSRFELSLGNNVRKIFC